MKTFVQWIENNEAALEIEEAIKEVVSMLINYAEYNIGQVTHIISYAESVVKKVKKGLPLSPQIIPMFNVVEQVASGKMELEDLKELGMQAKKIYFK